MSRVKASRGFVIITDNHGQISDVLRDDLELFDSEKDFPKLIDIMDNESKSKAESFLSALRTEQAIYGWEMNILLHGEITLVYFVGARHQNNLLLIGSTDPYGTHSYFDELVQINNEQVNAFRRALKDVFMATLSETQQIEEIYTRFMELNNELASMQRNLARKNRELEKLNEQKNKFIGMMAHDLRSPLGSIYLLSEFILMSGKERLSEDEKEALEQIVQMSEYMSNIISDLLDISVIESGNLSLDLQKADISESIQRCIKLNQLFADEKSISIISSQKGGDIPVTMMDISKVDQVINNLLSNAIKYSPRSTTIRIVTQVVDKTIVIDVSDEGQGIPKRELGRLFKPYGKTSIETTGGEKSTGLGLMIVKRIVEEHGGNIWVESVYGKGSTFSFSIPIT
ncbi:MAG: GHKL domain-containing protein [Candidatus Lokiarchaeota archaeon]|nr:GHKL domain-containing protein [Candidatus Lokiarchaeota archaeon]